MTVALHVLEIIVIVLVCLLLLNFVIYWFNLDMKLVHKLAPAFTRHYDKLPRDRRL